MPTIIPDIARFAQPELMEDSRQVVKWIEALLVEGVAILTDMPDSDEALTATVRLIGHVRPTFFGEYFDVKTHINPTNLAYTAKALELHTDTPAEEMAPGVQFLHCRANSVEGGESLFLDGVAVANDLREEFPEDFKLLSETSIPYYCEHDSYDMRSRQRVIELDEHGEVCGVTISQHMADIFDLPQSFPRSLLPGVLPLRPDAAIRQVPDALPAERQGMHRLRQSPHCSWPLGLFRNQRGALPARLLRRSWRDAQRLSRLDDGGEVQMTETKYFIPSGSCRRRSVAIADRPRGGLPSRRPVRLA